MSEELQVLSRSRELTSEIYRLVKKLPKEEKYIIIPQILRAAISVSSNIAEGQQRGDKEFIRFINIARGSLEEVRQQLYIIQDEYKLDISKAEDYINQIGKMTYNLRLRLKTYAFVEK